MPGTGTGSASVSASSTAPEEPENGSVWFNADTGSLYVYLVDVDSGQWVQPSIPIADSLLDLGIDDGEAGEVLTANGDGTFSFAAPETAIVGNFTFANSTIDTTDDSAVEIVPNLTLGGDLIVGSGDIITTGSGTPELVSDNEILLTATTRVSISSSPLKLASFNSTDRDLLIAENGDMIYNSENNRPEIYMNGAWRIISTEPIV